MLVCPLFSSCGFAVSSDPGELPFSPVDPELDPPDVLFPEEPLGSVVPLTVP